MFVPVSDVVVYDSDVVVSLTQGDGGLEDPPGVLTLSKVNFSDAGRYTCVAGNSRGHDYKSVWLTVLKRQYSAASCTLTFFLRHISSELLLSPKPSNCSVVLNVQYLHSLL